MNIRAQICDALPGWNGRLAVHHICYLGDGHVHRAVPYNALDPKVVSKKIELMETVGIDVVICTVQGPWATACDQDVHLIATACAQAGMQFCLLLDPGGMQKWTPNLTQAQITANVESALNSPSWQSLLASTAYVPEKFVLDFGTGANLATLATAFPSIKFLPMGSGFSWISIPSITDSVKRNAAAVAALKSQNLSPFMKIPGLCFSFDDSGMPLPAGVQSQAIFDADGGVRNLAESVWGGPARVMESFAGQFFLQQLAVTPITAPIIALVTWDDVDEQSSGPLEKVLAELHMVNWSAL